MNGKQKILIADDSEINRALLMEILGDGYEYLEAENGVRAVELLREHTDIALVLLDIMMPQMDGFDVLKVMRCYSWLDEIPVIMISAAKDTANIERAYDLGVADYMRRPFERVMVLRRFVQRTGVGAVCLDLGAVCATVGLLLVGAVGVLCKAHGALRRLFHAVGALHTHIVLLMLPNLPVDGGQRRRTGRVTHCMGQLGGRALLVHLLKGKARRYPAGFRVNDALLFLYGFLGYLRLGLFQLLIGFIRFFDGLFQFRRCQLLVGKQQPGRAFAHGVSPPFGAYGTPRKSSTLPQPNLWIQKSYCLGCVSAMR